MKNPNKRQQNLGINNFTNTVIVIILLTCSSANALEFEKAKLKHQFTENVQTEVNVSGNIIVGIMISSAYKGLQNDTLALMPATFSRSQEVCLKVTSRDATYTSKNSYLINANTKNYKKLPYASQHKDILSQFTKDDAAISATAGPCDKTSSDYYLLTSIDQSRSNEAKITTGKLAIYVNGFDATDVYYQAKPGETSVEDECDYITEGRHTAYNFICRIDITPKEDTDLPISILREVYGRELPTIDIHILGAY